MLVAIKLLFGLGFLACLIIYGPCTIKLLWHESRHVRLLRWRIARLRRKLPGLPELAFILSICLGTWLALNIFC